MNGSPAASALRSCVCRGILLGVALTVTLSSCGSPTPDTSPGVSRELAEHRRRTVSDVRYELTFNIPDSADLPIQGALTTTFVLSDSRHPLVLDFAGPPDGVSSVTVDGQPVRFELVGEHILLPPDVVHDGEIAIAMQFVAGDGALNRNDEFLYTLLVPDRARSAFPSFDQPNLKARYRLALTVPAAWEAVSNAAIDAQEEVAGRKHVRFAETKPISTYLFAFAAGRFDVVTAERDGRTMRLYHRETDSAKVARNIDAIFDLHASALSWLEDYTAIPYPFVKFDFVAIPSFQYGGMEHPGSTLYRASSLFLDESATQSQYLGRASLIAHETSHMWFGDLVTMDWFDDVWMKEVFANFMAAKIVNPSFPEVDHGLRFFLAHHAAAYGIDRTEGANPIRQDLENLNEAGSLYGAIIYQKAPIVMKHLERIVGEEALRTGLREYLTRYAFSNATWTDLVTILDQLTVEDLGTWSRVWVDEPGRPTVRSVLDVADGRVTGLVLQQTDAWARDLEWPQHMGVALGYRDTVRMLDVYLDDTAITVPEAIGLPVPSFLLPGGDGLGYAHFPLDKRSRDYLLRHTSAIEHGIVRAVAWMALWESVLYYDLAPSLFIEAALEYLPRESDEQNVQRVLGFLGTAFWHFCSPQTRVILAPHVERVLWSEIERASSTSRKATFFDTYVSVAASPGGVRRLEDVWRGSLEVEGLPLAERHLTTLAEALAMRNVSRAEAILDEQLGRIANPDRRARFQFVRPALSSTETTRDSVFESFRDARNREREPWVLSAVSFLHHPLRAASSEKYILPSLALVEEIQRTGDIFFPLRWLDATLSGHQSQEAALVVRAFLDDHPDYPPRLRAKILQAADELFRAAEWQQR